MREYFTLVGAVGYDNSTNEYILPDGTRVPERDVVMGGLGPYRPAETPIKETQGDQRIMRQFATGATRDTDEHKPDYEGFLSPRVIRSFGDYMTKHRVQADGNLRDSDNWQKGIPKDAYMKSMWRHFMDVWELHRHPDAAGFLLAEALNALYFNVQGYLHEHLKEIEAATAPAAGDSDRPTHSRS